MFGGLRNGVERGEKKTILLLKKLDLKRGFSCARKLLYKECKNIKGIVLAKMCRHWNLQTKLEMIPKAQARKEKKQINWTVSKLITCPLKDTINKVKRQPKG